jgi:hypothetical protein
MAKKVFFPPKTFDDDLQAFAELYKNKGWSFSGVESDKLLADPALQRDERAEHDKLELQYLSVRETFIREQELRYHRFAAALNAARGAFRTDPIVSKELARFKRSIRRPRPTVQPPE